jgi:aconitate hydratase
VKSSLAPGSKTVALYLDEAGLTAELEKLGFGIVAFACTTCNGMSGALDPKIQQEIIDRDLYTTAVLSGNRNFDGRIHPYAKQAFLASPPLVVAYAIAGTIRFDIEQDVLGTDASGKEIRLKDIWPTDEEIDAVATAAVKPEQFRNVYAPMFGKGVRRSARYMTGARKAPTSAARPIGKARWPVSAPCAACGRWQCSVTTSRQTTCRRPMPSCWTARPVRTWPRWACRRRTLTPTPPIAATT